MWTRPMDEVLPIGVHPVQRKPLRALVLVGVSRTMVTLLAAAVAWTASIARSVDAGTLGALGGTLAVAESIGPVAGTASIAAMLDDVASRSARDRASLVDVEVTRGGDRRAGVVIVVDVLGEGSRSVDAFVASLEQGVLDDVRPRSVDRVPTGHRLRIDGGFELVAAPVATTSRDARATAVVLAELAESAGVQLGGATVATEGSEPVRISVAGRMDGLVRLVDLIESGISAPTRIRSLSIRRTSSGAHEASLVFTLREEPNVTLGWEPR